MASPTLGHFRSVFSRYTRISKDIFQSAMPKNKPFEVNNRNIQQFTASGVKYIWYSYFKKLYKANLTPKTTSQNNQAFQGEIIELK